MSETNPYTELLNEITSEQNIKSFDDLKNHLSNELLSYYQFDLPKEFDLVDLTKIRYNFRYMRNFSKTISFSKSLSYIREELTNYFHYQPQAHISPENKKTKKIPKVTNFKQVFFDLKSDSGESMVLEDITDFSLETVTAESLKGVIDEFRQPIVKTDPNELNSLTNTADISSKTISSSIQERQQSSSIDSIVNDDIEKLMKDFNIEKIRSMVPEEKVSNSESSENLLDETFKLLGLGSIKKNLGKTIISKKKSEGLFFDEWVQENLSWVQFLIKNILRVDYLSLKDESHYLAIVRNHEFSDSFEEELKSLYIKLKVES